MNESVAVEFFRLGVLYHLFTNMGVLFLRHRQIDKYRYLSYELEFRKYGTRRSKFLDLISLSPGGWNHIAPYRYKIGIWPHEFLVIRDHHLPSCIAPEEFTQFDAFVTMDLVIRGFPYRWTAGSSQFLTEFVQTYYDYFDKAIGDKSKAITFLKAIREKYGKYPYIEGGVGDVMEAVLQKFDLKWEDVD